MQRASNLRVPVCVNLGSRRRHSKPFRNLELGFELGFVESGTASEPLRNRSSPANLEKFVPREFVESLPRVCREFASRNCQHSPRMANREHWNRDWSALQKLAEAVRYRSDSLPICEHVEPHGGHTLVVIKQFVIMHTQIILKRTYKQIIHTRRCGHHTHRPYTFDDYITKQTNGVWCEI